MVTNIDGVRAAVKAGEIASDMFSTDDVTKDEADAFIFTAMLRAYLDARGLVMVPKEPTDEMIGAGIIAYDGKCEASYAAMLAAAPDPFGDAE